MNEMKRTSKNVMYGMEKQKDQLKQKQSHAINREFGTTKLVYMCFQIE